MWFKLAAANFSAKNLGKMADISNSYSINYNISGFAKTTAPTSVEKGKTISEITLTLQENYEMTGTATLTYGATSLNATVSGSTYKWTNITPTGSVTITAKATWVGSGEEPDNGGSGGDSSGGGGGTTYLDLSSVTWTQGHYDANGNATGTSNSMYEYRIGSNLIEIPAAARGKKLYFELNSDYEINFRSGPQSNPYRDNYYYISYAATQEDSGANGACRGYAVQLASDATHMRLMMSHDDSSASSVNNLTTKITPSEAASAGLKIYYKNSSSSSGGEAVSGSTLDLSSLVWTQGHYDSNCADTGSDNQYYNYRVRSNILDVSSVAGKTLHFDMGDNYRINLRAGTDSSWDFNYFYVNPNASSADSGSNSGSRGYEVTLPATTTRMRMMMSFKGSSDSDVANTTTTITPAQANASGLTITVK